ncbi:MAG: cytochrome c [Gammaproteobacteria bacterium]
MTKLLLAIGLLALSGGVYAAEDHGAELYKLYCTQCHGVNGNGKGINAAAMSVAPRDHTDTKEMSARTDEELFKVIQNGGKSINKSILMPVWGGNFSDDDIHALVAQLRKMCCSN